MHRAVRAEQRALLQARETLAAHLPKVGFPTVELEPGRYLAESDAIAAWFAERADIEIATLPTFQYFVGGMFTGHIALYLENMQLKQQG